MRPSCSTSETVITRPAFSAPIAEPGTGIVNAASFDGAQSLVLRRIQKMQKPASRRPFPLLLPFVREIISERHRVLRGNPRPPAVGRLGKQRDHPLFLRCFGCFPGRDTGSTRMATPSALVWVRDMHVKAVSQTASFVNLTNRALARPRRSVVRSRCRWHMNRPFESQH